MLWAAVWPGLAYLLSKVWGHHTLPPVREDLLKCKLYFFFTLKDFKYNYTPQNHNSLQIISEYGATVPFYCCELRYILVCINN